MKLEEIEKFFEKAFSFNWHEADSYVDTFEEIIPYLLDIAKAAQTLANIEHLSLDPRFDTGKAYKDLENAFKNLEGVGD